MLLGFELCQRQQQQQCVCRGEGRRLCGVCDGCADAQTLLCCVTMQRRLCRQCAGDEEKGTHGAWTKVFGGVGSLDSCVLMWNVCLCVSGCMPIICPSALPFSQPTHPMWLTGSSNVLCCRGCNNGSAKVGKRGYLFEHSELRLRVSCVLGTFCPALQACCVVCVCTCGHLLAFLPRTLLRSCCDSHRS